ncbi:MAG: agmatinase family protein [Planctomycetota bacterium]
MTGSHGDPADLFQTGATRREADIVLIPAPLEATVSYGGGTRYGPTAIARAAPQLDEVDPVFGPFHETRIIIDPLDESLGAICGQVNEVRQQPETSERLGRLNELTIRAHDRIHALVTGVFDSGKTPGVIGGEHSVAYGAIRAAADRYEGLGVLQIDAHMDLRENYEGYVWSHASVMHNVVELPRLGILVQVGVRDISADEYAKANADPKIRAFPMGQLDDAMDGGAPWSELRDRMIDMLPERVWVSFDIDGLEPHLCPGTGTPVPGGLSFHRATSLLQRIRETGRKVVGFDLVEVAPSLGAPEGRDSIDAIVGARVLARLCIVAGTAARLGR